MAKQPLFLKTIVGVFAFSLAALRVASATGGEQTNELDSIKAMLTQVLSAVNAPTASTAITPSPVALPKTRLLYTYVINVNGFDTGIAISNTGVDNTGTIGTSGTAIIYFFGAGAPAPFTTPNISAGTSYANLISTLAPGFSGYVEVVCNFPFAHGVALITDLGAKELGLSVPALVLPQKRAAPESLGQ